ncbi:type III pantothenate kinase [Polaribacter sp. MED152]|uniref:type III pantothenate kinase n=1 Tax=Polaribacter sp. MED152 TaxID=313598 RepID=UPI0000689A32|nr:type III pantothenate kinase [Polaribacter sp. MED152]EAQ40645.1 Bvg accessory factor family protein [Polaribacter sp. MED152]
MNLTIDVGNTRVKAAVFEDDKLLLVEVFMLDEIITEIKKIVESYAVQEAIIANVSSISEKLLNNINKIVPLTRVSSTMQLPFTNNYATPHTLGLDRLALVFGAVLEHKNQNILIIDAGTCITYDFVSEEKEYFGGAISPGIQMRYKSLNHYTSKLPLLDSQIPNYFIGDSTEESIHSGVVNGVVQEIEGIISQYKNKYSDLTVVLTGGDTNFLSKQLKSSIFANQNFLLEGLNRILIFNNNK